MKPPHIRLHRKLYRARAVDQAIEMASTEGTDLRIERQRDGDHHVVTIEGLELDEAREALAEIADAALMITVELDRR